MILHSFELTTNIIHTPNTYIKFRKVFVHLSSIKRNLTLKRLKVIFSFFDL